MDVSLDDYWDMEDAAQADWQSDKGAKVSNVVTGFVKKLNTKTGTGRKGPWTAYSMRVQDKAGTEIDTWFNLGFEDPGIKEGDYIQFTAVPKDEKSSQVDPATIRKSKNPPAAPPKQESRGNGGGNRGGYTNNNAAKEKYWADKDKRDIEVVQPRIQYQNARTQAIAVVDLLLRNDALSITKAQTKAGEAKRFNEIIASIDKLTVKYHNDTESLRVLENVSDTGAATPADPGDLPADQVTGSPGNDEGFDDETETPEEFE